MAGGGNGDDAIIVALGGNLPGAWPSLAAVIEAALARLDEVGLNLVAVVPVALGGLARSVPA